jgi:hypothetical protein
MTASRRGSKAGRSRSRGAVSDPSEAVKSSRDGSMARSPRSRPTHSPTERLAQLVGTNPAAREVAELGRVVYTPAGLDRFLSTPMAVFDGRTAIELLENDQAERVLAALAADYEGLGY